MFLKGVESCFVSGSSLVKSYIGRPAIENNILRGFLHYSIEEV